LRPLHEIRGLRYPDEFLVRHFFRRGLDKRPGRVVELGCGSGQNLTLYEGFGWKAAGVDIDRASIENARWNLGPEALLVEADLTEGAPPGLEGPWDAFLAPSSLYYLGADYARRRLEEFAPRLSPGCEVYVRLRLVDDYRFARGERVALNTFRLATPETGEAGLINQFYTEAEAVDLLRETLDLKAIQTLRVRFDSIRQDVLLPGNSDVILMGVTPS
jgi:SAM-dependent methyltransferase